MLTAARLAALFVFEPLEPRTFLSAAKPFRDPFPDNPTSPTGFYSIGGAGRTVIEAGDFGMLYEPVDSVVGPDGKLILAGYAGGGWGLARLNPDGSLDHSFGKSGEVTLYSGGGANQVLLQPDGKLIVRGDNGIARLNSDGTLDTSFGTSGWIGEEKTARQIAGRGRSLWFTNLSLEGDGQLLVAAVLSTANSEWLALLHFNADGTVDTSYGAGGLHTVMHGGYYIDWLPEVLDKRGLLIAQSDNSTTTSLLRITPEGSIDEGFASDVDLSFWPDYPRRTTADGRYILNLHRKDAPGSAPVRLNADGSMDRSFADAAAAAIGANASVEDLQIRADGGILAMVYGPEGRGVKALSPDGSLDVSFGSGGFLPVGDEFEIFEGFAVYPNGKFAMFARLPIPDGCRRYCAESTDLLTARFNADGTPDLSFGSFSAAPILAPMDSSVGKDNWQYDEEESDQDQSDQNQSDQDQGEEDESGESLQTQEYVDPLAIADDSDDLADASTDDFDVWDVDSDSRFWDSPESVY